MWISPETWPSQSPWSSWTGDGPNSLPAHVSVGGLFCVNLIDTGESAIIAPHFFAVWVVQG